MRGIYLNGTKYYEGSKCPCCSSERDKGGRLELKKRTRYFLKCALCDYTILSNATRNNRDDYFADQRNK